MPENYLVIGLMSGTSLDGLDIACVEFSVNSGVWEYNFRRTSAVTYNEYWREQLAKAINLTPESLGKLDRHYGQWLGEQVRDFIRDNQLKVDLIASHGHTVFHQPEKGITRQIGDGQAISEITNIVTVCDFRSLDVELGGQGAPLVPIGDKLLFEDYLACLNLGGIANISFAGENTRLAFDIGMANLPLNYFVAELGLEFDENGDLASSGSVNTNLLKALNQLTYFNRLPPKSLGIEWFFSEMLPLINSFSLTTEDKLATLVEHEAYQIGKAISAIDASGDILLSGGGAKNKFLVEKIKSNLRDDHVLMLPNIQLIDFKEALIFALMGVLRYRNEINCLKSVTGASRDSSSGRIFNPH